MAEVLRVPRIRAMKKDSNHSNSGEKVASRPSSASSVSSKSSSQKREKHKEKGPTRDELIDANTELSAEVEALNTENQLLKSTITAFIDKLIENAKIKGVRVPHSLDNPNVAEIPADTLVTLTEKLTAESRKSDTVEFRVEELETRITHLNTELAKLLRTRVNVENGLDELLKDCKSADEMKKKAQDLMRDVRSTKLFTFLDSVPLPDSHPGDVTPLQAGSCPRTSTPRTQGPAQHPHKTITVILKDENLNLTPPAVKMAGDTHIKNMHKDLRQYVIQQLSLPKGSGADWRLMGERLGIPEETISQWKRWKLDLPMYYVLQSWSQSAGASVRMLHRHLVSPQMRCTLLAKRISDFYKVD
ncbi:hypothetical protein MAR_001091 [Mya arenaria]|uniref:Death domain-containing protein n=1 Tax=Mya arenaria TaxID=6604 RepID=A0ABY7FEU2_MYAAR|nr:uncharacterized protein LOC128208148 [Mya arenaria]XP_052767501.1 uncharacterized protein LOC128208148 [Mya arenaria]XP_052767502.1 uncharacterized protein LOC128208148 [Mya arenaria]WAR19253.1 hypothetical protein MAR_001091 [Mya arenaria]